MKPRPFTQSDTPPDSAARRHCLLDLSTAINTAASGLTVTPPLTSSLPGEGRPGGGGADLPPSFVLPHSHQSASTQGEQIRLTQSGNTSSRKHTDLQSCINYTAGECYIELHLISLTAHSEQQTKLKFSIPITDKAKIKNEKCF